jgi:hypothetical protein
VTRANEVVSPELLLIRNEGISESEIEELLAVGFSDVMMNMLTDTYDVPCLRPETSHR